MPTELTPETAKLVRVDWEDIKFDDSWGEEENSLNPVESMTVGYLIVKTASKITIASSYDYQTERWGTQHTFSRAMPKITVLAGDRTPSSKKAGE